MLKYIVITLVTLELVLLSAFIPARASSTPQNLATYAWGYPFVGSSQLVCKKIEAIEHSSTLPQLDRQQMAVHSSVVSNDYCANLTKPRS